jgi:2-oxoglutarate ferredoxin oxidoreductase subunit beta
MRAKDAYSIGKPTWCRGCGLYAVLEALKRAASALDIDPDNMVVVTGIGCHGRLNSHFLSYAVHGLHGRAIPLAEGLKLANAGLTVAAVSGDGDAYSIGLGHFIHAVRRNISLTYIVVDNRVYALTQGQTSPTSLRGTRSISTPGGSKEYPLDGLKLALASGGTFIGRGFAGEVGPLAALLESALRHKGFSLVEVLSPCVTHNRVNTYDWFKGRLLRAESEPGHGPGDRQRAWALLDEPERLSVGLIYREEKPPFEETMLEGFNGPLVRQNLAPNVPVLEKVLEEFS